MPREGIVYEHRHCHRRLLRPGPLLYPPAGPAGRPGRDLGGGPPPGADGGAGRPAVHPHAAPGPGSDQGRERGDSARPAAGNGRRRAGAGQLRRVRQVRHLRRHDPPGDGGHDRPKLPGGGGPHRRRHSPHEPGRPHPGDLLLRRLPAPARLQRLRRHQGLSAAVQPGSPVGGGSPGHQGDSGVPRLDQNRIHAGGRDTKNGRTVRSYPFALRPETVARRALRDSQVLAVTTCGLPALVQRVASKFLPHCFIMACWEGLRRL